MAVLPVYLQPIGAFVHQEIHEISNFSCPIVGESRSNAQIFSLARPTCVGIGNIRRHVNSVRCMASNRRVTRISTLIWRELDDMLLNDDVLRSAVMPEARFGVDSYLSVVATISRVRLSNDLLAVKAYVSVFSDNRGKALAIEGLKGKAKYIRFMLGKRLKLRRVPEIHIIKDIPFEKSMRVSHILDKMKEEQEMDEKERKELGFTKLSELVDSDFDNDDY